MKITIVTVSTSVLFRIIKAAGNINNNYPDILDLKLFFASRKLSDNKIVKMNKCIKESDAVIVDLMGSCEKIVKNVNSSLKKCSGNIIPVGRSGREYLRLGSFKASDMGRKKLKDMNLKMNADAMKKMADMSEKIGKAVPFGKPKDMRNLVQISKYFKNADINQLENMLILLLRDYGGYEKLPKPKEALEESEIIIREPKEIKSYRKYSDYVKDKGFKKDLPVVAVLYYGHTYPNDTSDCISRIKKRLERFANVLPIAFTRVSKKNQAVLKEFLSGMGVEKPAAVLNFLSFRIGAGPMGGDAQYAVDILKETGVPVFHPFFMSKRRISEWEESAQGINSMEFMLSVMLPELDGCIETYPVGAMKYYGMDKEFDIEIEQLDLIDERVEKLVKRVENWLELRRKTNSKKKVAVICYNYPPGEGNIFGGAFLDTFESVENLMSILKENGYDANDVSKEYLLKRFTEDGGISNSGRWSENNKKNMLTYNTAEYIEENKNKYYKDEIEEQWGMPTGSIMCEDNEFLIPGIIEGNIFIGLQPSRGVHEDPSKVYHDKSLLPHHQYIAFYKWLRDEFKADAIIHVGTHGTLEFLRGKECGMSEKCFPDMLIENVPHIYLYYCGNPAEGMIAKRRSHAVINSYQPPVFIRAKLYGEYVNISAMIDEYYESLRLSPVRSSDILKNIIDKAKENNLPDKLEDIEHELYRMERSLIPKGLHVYGRGYNHDEAVDYVKSVMRYDRGDIKSLKRILAESRNIDYDKLLEENVTGALSELDIEADKMIEEFFNEKKEAYRDIIACKKNEQDHKNSFLYAKKIYQTAKMCFEKEGLLKCLDGGYLPAGIAGDIIRNPDVLPSGRNIYQFDPRFVPSQTAYLRGRKIAENTVNKYKDENGTWPLSTAVILWGLETSRTQGETVGQVLSYLGIRAVKGKNVWEPKYEIIPLNELKRPRIDVVVNMCGFFRDMFPNIIDDINKLLIKLQNLDEPDDMNYYKKNTKRIYEKLIKEGYDEKEAKELAGARIFGPAEAEYGTGITKLIETKNWETEEQFGEGFVKSMRHVYSSTFRGRDTEELLNMNLEAVDIVSQIRSSHEYEVTDLDHYYEFFGGLAKSVEMAKGSKSKIYITDTTGEKVQTESVEKSINRGIRTRMLNPGWIDGMLEHKYHGVQKIAQRFENVMGLAATTNSVEQWVFNELHNKYVRDKKTSKSMKENNRWAYFNIVEQMLEYSKRGYWDADDKQLDELKNKYLELEGDIEENT